jgi:hypothetical protein
MDDAALVAAMRQTQQLLEQLKMDVAHRENERDAYFEYERKTDLKTFPYLGRLQDKLLRLAKNGLAAKEKELGVLTAAAQSRRQIL